MPPSAERRRHIRRRIPRRTSSVSPLAMSRVLWRPPSSRRCTRRWMTCPVPRPSTAMVPISTATVTTCLSIPSRAAMQKRASHSPRPKCSFRTAQSRTAAISLISSPRITSSWCPIPFILSTWIPISWRGARSSLRTPPRRTASCPCPMKASGQTLSIFARPTIRRVPHIPLNSLKNGWRMPKNGCGHPL